MHEGYGILSLPDGSRYVGQLKADKKNGNGMLTTAKGQTYIGDWKDDQYKGPGTLAITDGKGIMTLANGKRYALIFSSDQQIVSIRYIDG